MSPVCYIPMKTEQKRKRVLASKIDTKWIKV